MIYNNDQEICDDYGFRFLDQVETPAVQLFAVGKQSRNTNQYYWNNKDRYPSFLFQYTLNGSGTLNVNNKTHIIKKGKLFFCKYRVMNVIILMIRLMMPHGNLYIYY